MNHVSDEAKKNVKSINERFDELEEWIVETKKELEALRKENKELKEKLSTS